MTDARLPMTVIGGYLGAGKTTLLNRLLSAPHGLRLMVLVNDFGAINIDADLVHSADADTLTLTNGCVCCTMGGDLFMAIADVLARNLRPDHLLIEASGVANPRKIANAAIAEPDLRYAGIVTVVDGDNGFEMIDDPQVGAQMQTQIACADLLCVSKTGYVSSQAQCALRAVNPRAPILLSGMRNLSDLLLSEHEPQAPAQSCAPHPDYIKWAHQGPEQFDFAGLRALMQSRPASLYRIKGFVRGKHGVGWLLQGVGREISLTSYPQPTHTRLIAIGLASECSEAHCEAWWHGALRGGAVEKPRPGVEYLRRRHSEPV